METLLLVGLLSAGDPRLIVAVKSNDPATVRSLVAQHVDVNATEADGSTPLHWAVQRDNLDVTSLLLSAGANAKAATRYNVTPLFLAATNGNAAIIERLLKAGADPQGTPGEGQAAPVTALVTVT